MRDDSVKYAIIIGLYLFFITQRYIKLVLQALSQLHLQTLSQMHLQAFQSLSLSSLETSNFPSRFYIMLVFLQSFCISEARLLTFRALLLIDGYASAAKHCCTNPSGNRKSLKIHELVRYPFICLNSSGPSISIFIFLLKSYNHGRICYENKHFSNPMLQ